MKTRVADPALRREVEAAVRRRVRGDEAEDVVQATFADVLAAQSVPEEPEEFRRFVFGVARNKVYDYFRRQKRVVDGVDADLEPAPEAEALSARDMLRWAEGELPDSESQSTLEWMLREGDGEKLEHIAQDARLPAPRVRKRVSRLRKLLRERWAAQLALAIALIGGIGAYLWIRKVTPPDVVKREVIPVPSARAPEPSRPAGDASAMPPPSAAPAPSGLQLPPNAIPPLNGTPAPHSSVPSPKPTAQRMAPPDSTEKVAPFQAPSKVAPRSPKVGPSPQDFSSNQIPDRKGSEVIDLEAPKQNFKAKSGKAPSKAQPAFDFESK